MNREIDANNNAETDGHKKHFRADADGDTEGHHAAWSPRLGRGEAAGSTDVGNARQARPHRGSTPRRRWPPPVTGDQLREDTVRPVVR